jgi:hypothetical protein
MLLIQKPSRMPLEEFTMAFARLLLCGSSFASSAVLTLVLAGGAGVANAATCTASSPDVNADPLATLTNSTSCGPGTGNNDTAALVNSEEPSSLVWSFIEKDEAVSNSGSLLFSGSTDGDWGIDDTGLAAYDSFLITLKDGNDISPSWYWFIIDTSTGCSALNDFASATYCGEWTMYGKNGRLKEISHMSLYGANSSGTTSGSTGTVPEPGTSGLALLALGLLGAGIGLRRKPTSGG